jgi:hypothetical protein
VAPAAGRAEQALRADSFVVIAYWGRRVSRLKRTAFGGHRMLHADTASMLGESLVEYLITAESCVGFVKDASWGQNQLGGCLGYPAAALLFCIADTIGSFHRGDAGFQVEVDGATVSIASAQQHLRVLNSAYYGQALSGADLNRLRDNYRNLLVHNAALAPDHFLLKDPANPAPFPHDGAHLCVNVSAFAHISRHAVESFLAKVNAVVPGSVQEAIIKLKT